MLLKYWLINNKALSSAFTFGYGCVKGLKWVENYSRQSSFIDHSHVVCAKEVAGCPKLFRIIKIIGCE